MKLLTIIALLGCLLTGCASQHGYAEPSANKAEFPGFDFSEGDGGPVDSIFGYEYQQADGNVVIFKSCDQAEGADEPAVAEFEYFRFQQLLLMCKAAELYSGANASRVSYFPASFDKAFYETLPAIIAPLLSQQDRDQRQGASLAQYNSDTVVTLENEYSAKANTEEDEIYLTVLARGDFTGDGFEDLLIKSEWYGVDSFGKHLDLLILSKTATNETADISWRWNRL